MPKITHAADGPTHHVGQTQEPAAFIVTRSVVGGERESVPVVGGNSSASSSSDETPNEFSSVSPREPAPTTESPSRQDQTESSTVSTTDGNGQETESQPSDNEEWDGVGIYPDTSRIAAKTTPRRVTKKTPPVKRVPRSRVISTDDFADDEF